MSRRIRVSRGTLARGSNDLGRRLKGLVTNYRFALVSKQRALEQGKRLIDNHFETMLRLSRDRIRTALKVTAELPPEERKRLERWRDDYVADFEKILDDVR